MPNATTATTFDTESRELARDALAALILAESAAYMQSSLFDFGGAWSDSPIGSALLAAETALRIIADDMDGRAPGDFAAMIAAQTAYTEQVWADR
jgi:hypothetical protein